MTMNDKFKYIPNADKQNYFFCRFKFMVDKFGHSYFKPTNHASLKYPKFNVSK